MKFSQVRKASVVTEKYAATSNVITMTLPSRSVSSRLATPAAPEPEVRPGCSASPRPGWARAGTSLAVSAGTATPW